MLDRILVPLDGSILADRVLLHVRRLLVREDAEVLLFRVLEGTSPSRPRVVQEMERGFATTHLEDQRRRLADQGARVRSEVAEGDPAEQILARCETWRPSLLAMSTHGRTGLDRWVWGSVAERVLREARHPVFLTNPRALPEEPFPTEGRFRRILVPLDGSETSASILPIATAFARLYESEVLLIHCVPPLLSYPSHAEMESEITEEKGLGVLEPHRMAIQEAGLKVRTLVRAEYAASAILDAALGERADLVAMTTHGRTGLARWAFGSVAEKVIRHCPCPVIVKRGVSAVL